MSEKTKIILKKILYSINILYLAAITLATIASFCMWPGFLFVAACSCDAPGSCEGIGEIIPIFIGLTPLVLLGGAIIAFHYFFKKKYLKSIGISLGLLIGIYVVVGSIGLLSNAYYRGNLL